MWKNNRIFVEWFENGKRVKYIVYQYIVFVFYFLGPDIINNRHRKPIINKK